MYPPLCQCTSLKGKFYPVGNILAGHLFQGAPHSLKTKKCCRECTCNSPKYI